MAKNRFTVTLAGDLLGTFDERDLTLEDAFVLENECGLTFNDMLTGLRDLRPLPLRSLVWFMRYKRGDQVRPEQINFKLTELETELVEDPTTAGDPQEGDATVTSEPSPITAG